MALHRIALVPPLIALIAGLVIHSFIIVVNVNDWRKGRSVTPVDQVVTSIGISRICLQCQGVIYLFVSELFMKNLYLRLSVVIMDLVYSLFIYCNFWLTSLLSIVFCLKISSLRTRLFLYLRRMIEQRTVHFIVASGLFSFCNCLLPLLMAITEISKGGAYNTTMENLIKPCEVNSYIYAHSVSALAPLLFCCISSVVLFSSLYHHITKMKMSDNLSINLETYYSAIKYISFTFIYNIICCTGHFACVIYYSLFYVNVFWFYISLGFLPVLHSSYLIYITAKLRSQMSKVLQNITGFLFRGKDPETREDIEVVDQ